MLEYIISLMRIKVTLTGGAKRDSGYIYGPGMPRSYFAGVKLSFLICIYYCRERSAVRPLPAICVIE